MRELLTTIVELLGLVAITVGSAMIYRPAGLIVGGASAVIVGYLERPIAEPVEPTE